MEVFAGATPCLEGLMRRYIALLAVPVMACGENAPRAGGHD